ncbi:MAG: hypothetical protein MRY83_12890, partial [Flavobacteriales bacterium]|nr:hypothetical protein [Flavobacteriales bacterium]
MNKGINTIIRSPIFICAVALTAINDHFLKFAFPGLITGKISDFAGIFAFTLFWSSIFPKRKYLISVIIGFTFIWWKSPLSSPFIECWNSLNLFDIARVIDYTDLFALFMIPLSLKVMDHQQFVLRFPRLMIYIASVLVFCATSYQHSFEYNQIYELNIPLNEAVEKLNTLCQDSICKNLPISSNFQNRTGHKIVDSDTLWYYSTRTNIWFDTIWKYESKFSPNKNGLF